MPEDVKTWQEMLGVVDWWGVRVGLALFGVAIITYPLWAAGVRRGMRLPWGSTLWGGIVFTLSWKMTAWKERRALKRQRRDLEREKKRRGGGE